jgi:hypothetical protein
LIEFKQSVGKEDYQKLKAEADRKEISVQELLRSIVIPDWLEGQKHK